MVKKLVLACVLLISATAFAVKPKTLIYDGDTVAWNMDWRRTKSGVVGDSLMFPEVSGIACSRVTPGYIWMESDDYTRVIATDEKGRHKYMQINFPNLKSLGIRTYDWEDMSGGIYEGTNYLFIGAFGDNEEVDDFYTIIYFEEPAITDGTKISINPSQIEYVYPDGKSHNCEALMYDNRDQMIYIITKVYYNVCQVFSLPFRLDYGDEVQTLTYVCDLGVKSDLGTGTNPYKGFHLVTGADISPDGKYILIKNHNNIQAAWSWTLLWTREDNESVSEAIINHRPELIYCYQSEWQGEAICWLDSTTFYTTSDSDGEPPIYKYTKKNTSTVQNVHVDSNKEPKQLVVIDNVMYIRSKEGLFTLDGRIVR